MNIKRLFLTTAVLGALGGLYGCSEGDESTVSIVPPPSDGGGNNGNGSVSQNCPDWASAKNQKADGRDVCALPASILESRTLTSDIVWYMEGRVTVGNGNGQMSATEGTLENGTAVVNAVLTIEAGTSVEAKKGTFANLIITRGSEIQAVGTADNPIVFSSDDDDFTGSGEWGGLILHGYAPHNNANDSTCGAPPCQNVDAEGESGFAAGLTPTDSSGRLVYVVVAEGGYEFSPGNEINGVSFVAVGSGTEVDYLQVHNNADDGVEFYGGTVNAKHLVLTGNLDDSVDWDEGYQGNLQHVLVKQSPLTEGNAIEADTEGSPLPLSKPLIANATFIVDGEKDTALVFKAASGGFLLHAVITSNPTASGGTGNFANCVDSSDAAISGVELVFENVVGDCATSGDLVLLPATIPDAQLDANYASQSTEASAVGSLDIAAFNATYAESVADPAFFDVTDYAGAVNPNGTDLWFQGWTVEGSL